MESANETTPLLNTATLEGERSQPIDSVKDHRVLYTIVSISVVLFILDISKVVTIRSISVPINVMAAESVRALAVMPIVWS